MKLVSISCLTVFIGSLVGCGAEAPEAPPSTREASVSRLDEAIDDIIPPNVFVEKVADGFQFTEGPVWIPGAPGKLFFSDIPANTVYSWSDAEGTQVVLQPVTSADSNLGGRGGSNGLALDADGRLVLCEHGNRRIARREDDGSRTTLADRYNGKRLNSPNDIVFHSSGSAYFTDPPYGLEGQDESKSKEQPFNGVYRLDADGTVTLLTTELSRPNGIALSPDERTLYVANSNRGPDASWMSFPVREDLSLGEGSLFFNATTIDEPGSPDGLAVDRKGNIFATGPGGLLILSPRGEHLGTIALEERAANVTWGDDGDTLYITASTSIYRIRLGGSQAE